MNGGSRVEDQIVEAWEIHNRIQIYVLESLTEASLLCASQGKGRTVGDHFAHIHNVRLMWITAAAPELMAGLQKLEKDAGMNTQAICDALHASSDTISALLKQSIAAGGKVKGFKPNVVAFLGYLISHESYHQGKIDLILRQAGTPVDDKTHYGMWEWGKR
jgi:uncharacterized damage-inducible protein DinB